MKKKISVYTQAALFGLLTGCSGAQESDPATAEPDAATFPTEDRPEENTEAPKATAEGEQPATPAEHGCRGMNECKGQGGCHVPGKNSCAGGNECKGQGGCCTLSDNTQCPEGAMGSG